MICGALAACSANKSGVAGGDAAAGAGGGEPAATAGVTGRAGAAGGHAGGAGGGPRDSGSSNSPADGGAGTINFGHLPGPAVDNQPPLAVGREYLFATDSAVLLADSAGNVFVIQDGHLKKLGPGLTPVWSFPFARMGTVSIGANEGTWSLAPDGGIFFAGSTTALPGETYAGGNTDATVAKVKADGTLAWIHAWGIKGSDTATVSVAAPDGAVLVAGTTYDLVPGSPADLKGGPWLARYEADGARTWLKQYAPLVWDVITNSIRSLFLDADGNIYGISPDVALKVDAQGTELGRTSRSFDNLYSYVETALNPAKDTFYTWGLFNTNRTWPYALGKFALDMRPEGYWDTEYQRVMRDDSNQVTWYGDFNSSLQDSSHIVVTGDAFYVTGHYLNRATETVFVGRYDLTGHRVWFQEYMFPSGISTAVDVTGVWFLGKIVLDPSGNPILLVHDGQVNTTTAFLFKLKATDGTLMSL